MVPLWIWLSFVFAFGCCVGSFLNVVIYRLPLDKSLAFPGSFCPNCGEYIRFYDNIPLLSWLLLGAKCRYCKTPISVRYFIVELLTGGIFVGLFLLYFRFGMRAGMESFTNGGWLVFVIHITLLSCLLASSAIDLELWVIPISICWFATAIGLLGSSVAHFVIEPIRIYGFDLLPNASTGTAALAVGAAAGLVISIIFLWTGLIKPSYECEESQTEESDEQQGQFNHRLEICREILYLLPIIICALIAFWLVRNVESIKVWWLDFSQVPVVKCLLGSLFGYFIGCGVVWATRIFGTLGFGKEAMGLGDVHLMGAVGAVLGPIMVTIAFFIAPFFGLSWAVYQMFFKETRQIPYGPFLSLGVIVVMIFHDSIFGYWNLTFYR